PRQLVGVANRPARTVGQGLETVFLIALEDLVAGLARNAERATDLAHRFAVQQLSDKPQTLVHCRTLLPRHPHLPRKGNGVTHVSGTICYLCLGPLTPLQVNPGVIFAPLAQCEAAGEANYSPARVRCRCRSRSIRSRLAARCRRS